jgi:hypothetical protein
MKTRSLPCIQAVVVLAVTLSTFACKPPAETINRQSAVITNVAPPVDPVAVEKELIRLERGWSDAAKNHDANAAGQILADDIFLTYPDGTTGTKADELRVISSGAMSVDSTDLLDTKVTVLNPESAFITGRSIIKNGKYKEQNTKAIDISGEYRFTDLYVKRNGKWQALASQTTKIENPTSSASPSKAPAKSSSPSPSPTPSVLPSPKTTP